MYGLSTIKNYIFDIYASLTFSYIPNKKRQVTPLATRRIPNQFYKELDGVLLKPPTLSRKSTTAEIIIYNSWRERIRDEVIPSPTRRYGFRPRGVILRIRNPPEWIKHPQAPILIREMNRRGFFNKTIDQAYRVHPIVACIQQNLMDIRLSWKQTKANIHNRIINARQKVHPVTINTQEATRNLAKSQIFFILLLILCILLLFIFF